MLHRLLRRELVYLNKLTVITLWQRVINHFRKNGIEYLYCLMWGLVIESLYLMLGMRNVVLNHIEHWDKKIDYIISHIPASMQILCNKQIKSIFLLMVIAFVIFGFLSILVERISCWRFVDLILFLLIIPIGLIQLLSPIFIVLSLLIFTRIVYVIRKNIVK